MAGRLIGAMRKAEEIRYDSEQGAIRCAAAGAAGGGVATRAVDRWALLEGSGVFDPQFYLARNPDVAASAYQPFEHYVQYGADENRQPSERFDPGFYRSQCAGRGIEPGNCVLHYLTTGRAAGLAATALEFTLRRSGVPVLNLAHKFESWGRDCEFGLVQRALGAEPNDLFRFSDPTPAVLVQLIRSGFEGYGEKCYIALDEQQPRREWFIVDHDTRTSRHSRIYEGDLPKEKVQELALLWTRLLREKAARDLVEGNKIYVMKTSQNDLTEDAVVEVARALRSKGRGWVLWVEAGDPPGHCEIAVDGLLRARIDRLCLRGHEYEFSLVGWLTVMCEAWNTLFRHGLTAL